MEKTQTQTQTRARAAQPAGFWLLGKRLLGRQCRDGGVRAMAAYLLGMRSVASGVSRRQSQNESFQSAQTDRSHPRANPQARAAAALRL